MTLEELETQERIFERKLADIRQQLASARESIRAVKATQFIAEHQLTAEMVEPEPPMGTSMLAYYALLDAQATVEPFAGFGGRVYRFDADRNLTETGVRLSELAKPTKSADSQPEWLPLSDDGLIIRPPFTSLFQRVDHNG